MSRLQDVRRILWVRTDRLGETLLNVPAAAALKAGLPYASLTWLAHPDLAGLLKRLPWIDEVLTAPQGSRRGWWARALQLGGRLRARRFDLAVISNPARELHLAAWLAGIPIRVGYERKWGCLLTHRLPDRRALGVRHEVEYNNELIHCLGLTPTPTVLVWGLTTGIVPSGWPQLEPEQREVVRLLAEQGVQPTDALVAVHPWTSNPVKQWPLARFRELLRRVTERLAVRAVVIGGAEEADNIQAVLPEGMPAANLVGRLTLEQLAALLQRVRCLVSNDSGPVHLAASVGTPTVVLFGTTDAATGPGRWGPWGSGHVVIWKPSMEEICVEDVVAALEQQLKRATDSPVHSP